MSTGPNESLNTTFSIKEGANFFEEKKADSFFSPFFNYDKKAISVDQQIFLEEDIEMNERESLEFQEKGNKIFSLRNSPNTVINLNSPSEEESTLFVCDLEGNLTTQEETNSITVINLEDSHHDENLNFPKINLNTQEDLIRDCQKKIKKLKKNFFVNFFKNWPMEDLPKYENLIKFISKEKDYSLLKEQFKNLDGQYVFNLFLYFFTLNEKINQAIHPIMNMPSYSDSITTKNYKEPKPKIFPDLEKRIQLAKNKVSSLNPYHKQAKKEFQNQIRERSRDKFENDESKGVDKKIKEIKECIRKINQISYYSKLQDLVGVTKAMSICKSLEEDKDVKILLLSCAKYNIFYKIQKREDSVGDCDYQMSYKVYKREKEKSE